MGFFTVLSLFFSIHALAITAGDVMENLELEKRNKVSENDAVALELFSTKLSPHFEKRWKTFLSSIEAKEFLPTWLSTKMKEKVLEEGSLIARFSSESVRSDLSSKYDLFFSPATQTWTFLTRIHGERVFIRKKARLFDGSKNFTFLTGNQAKEDSISQPQDQKLQIISKGQTEKIFQEQSISYGCKLPRWLCKALDQNPIRFDYGMHFSRYHPVHQMKVEYGLFYSLQAQTLTFLTRKASDRVIYQTRGVLTPPKQDHAELSISYQPKMRDSLSELQSSRIVSSQEVEDQEDLNEDAEEFLIVDSKDIEIPSSNLNSIFNRLLSLSPF